MHDNFQFGMTMLAILAGILFARRDAAETRSEIKSEVQRLDTKIDKLDGKVERLADRFDGDLKALRKDYTEFYAEQRRHDEAIETLKKKS